MVIGKSNVSQTQTDYLFVVRFVFRGHFFLTKAGQLRYKGGEHHSIGNCDPDKFSKVEIEAIYREDVHLTDIRELWYLTPRLTIDKGLRRIMDDMDVMDMLSLIGRKYKKIHIYVVTDTEISPVQVWENDVLPMELASLSVIPSITHGTEVSPEQVREHVFSQNSNKESPPNTDSPKHPSSPMCVSLSSNDDVPEQPLPTMNSSDDIEEFKDDDDDDDDDDALFDKYVDAGLETFDSVDDSKQLRDEKKMYDSDDIGNLDGCVDDDEERKHKRRYFNPVTDLKKNIELKCGMIFPDNNVFRRAVTQVSINSGGDYYFLHNWTDPAAGM